MKMIQRLIVAGSALLLVAPLVACSAGEPSETAVKEVDAVEETAGATSIAEVFEKIGCKEGDLLGTRGQIDEPGDFDYDPPLVKNGTCKPVEGGELTFFFQYESTEDAEKTVANGSIEVIATEQLFIDGSVLILARDAATSALVAKTAKPVN